MINEINRETCTREVTNILPTTTGLYLEEMRKAVHACLHNCVQLIVVEEDMVGDYEVANGNHPYRDAKIIPRGVAHPHEGWFWKY